MPFCFVMFLFCWIAVSFMCLHIPIYKNNLNGSNPDCHVTACSFCHTCANSIDIVTRLRFISVKKRSPQLGINIAHEWSSFFLKVWFELALLWFNICDMSHDIWILAIGKRKLLFTKILFHWTVVLAWMSRNSGN